MFPLDDLDVSQPGSLYVTRLLPLKTLSHPVQLCKRVSLVRTPLYPHCSSFVRLHPLHYRPARHWKSFLLRMYIYMSGWHHPRREVLGVYVRALPRRI